MRFERIASKDCDWAALDAMPDRTVFQTREWLSFLRQTQRAEPVVAALKEGADTVGYFTGAVITRMGVRILGSPLKGWATMYMGCNLVGDVPRRPVVDALLRFAFQDLRCVHVEIRDHALPQDSLLDAGFRPQELGTYLVDLSGSEDDVFARLRSSCRGRIRKAAKSGVVIEEAHDDAFAGDYYAQLRDVFAKQSLVPMYSRERVSALIGHLLPAGHLLLLRARDAEGTCIATGVFPGMNDSMYFWGGASWRSHQALAPNEALMWHAMRYWHGRGVTNFDMGGRGDYKKKYGGRPVAIPSFARSRFAVLDRVRDVAERGYGLRQRVSGRLRRGGSSSAPETSVPG